MNDLRGQRFGRLVVLDYHGVDKYGQKEWMCKCDCGNETIVKAWNLKSGKTVSCGCRRYDRFSEDLSGKRFGRLIVIKFDHMGPKGRAYWLCRCDCGNEIIARQDGLKNGHTRSCGCYAVDTTKKLATKHNLSSDRLYSIWRGMRYRCRDTNAKRYGGRGIEVCDEWENFESFYNWAMDNGYEPGLTIDRINNDGDYCPENCRWADNITQANNKCTNRVIEYKGIAHTVKEWSRLLGIHYETLRHQLNCNDMHTFENYFKED